ncbi:glycosyltransferase family 2 protein [Sulfitobacter sp. 1A15299]|uniref:glycosyltransferase family 2 protein n=1 Tax=Sulfitobacter sp. 1A15299 TaxID=3368598 RepID=UPI0037465CD9
MKPERNRDSQIFFGCVNYNSADEVQNYYNSISLNVENFQFVVADAYHSEAAREEINIVAKRNNFQIFEVENLGYSHGLNRLIELALMTNAQLFVVGNSDLLLASKFPRLSPQSKAYMPTLVEGRRNRNPFLNILQSKYLRLHYLAARYNLFWLFYVNLAALKVLGLLPARPWTCHGSLFIMDRSIANAKIFNENTFLYSEELEFGSYLSKNGYPLEAIDLRVLHDAHVSTGSTTKNKKKFFKIWRTGFLNWWFRYE